MPRLVPTPYLKVLYLTWLSRLVPIAVYYNSPCRNRSRAVHSDATWLDVITNNRKLRKLRHHLTRPSCTTPMQCRSVASGAQSYCLPVVFEYSTEYSASTVYGTYRLTFGGISENFSMLRSYFHCKMTVFNKISLTNHRLLRGSVLTGVLSAFSAFRTYRKT